MTIYSSRSDLRPNPIPSMNGDTGRDPRHNQELAKLFSQIMERKDLHSAHVDAYRAQQSRQKMYDSDAAIRRRFGLGD